MAADCIPRSLMEGDWTDNTDHVDPSIFLALSFVILRHLDIKVTHLSVSMELQLSVPHDELRSLSAGREANLFIQWARRLMRSKVPQFVKSNLYSLTGWAGYVRYSDTLNTASRHLDHTLWIFRRNKCNQYSKTMGAANGIHIERLAFLQAVPLMFSPLCFVQFRKQFWLFSLCDDWSQMSPTWLPRWPEEQKM